jgi:hypothetical protein
MIKFLRSLLGGSTDDDIVVPNVEPDLHKHEYCGGEDYPEHCGLCGISILDDEKYQEDQFVNVFENIHHLSGPWAIDRRAMALASWAVRRRAAARIAVLRSQLK